MNINLDLETLTELNQIRGLLLSPDFESQALGFEMFRNSSLFKNELRDLFYETKSKKQVPITWFMRKAGIILTENSDRIDDISQNLSTLILPIIDSILLCEPRFTSKITFNTDKSVIMKNYNPQFILKNSSL